MKILVISRSIHPEISPRSFRTTEIIKELSRQGHNVTLYIEVTSDEQRDLCKNYGVDCKNLGPLLFSKKIMTRSPILNKLFHYVRRIGYILFEYPDIELMFKVKTALKKEQHYDLLISIAVPHPLHWGVAWHNSKNGKIADCWIADCGDAYMGADFDTFRHPFYMGYLERWFCKHADFITIPNIEMRKNFYPQYKEKFREITQGFNFEESRKNLPKFQPNDIPTFLFSGTFIAGIGRRDPRPLLQYLIGLDKLFKFYIYTNSDTLIKDLVDQSQGRIIIRSFIPREELLQVQASMDFLVNIGYSPSRQLPSKLIDYYIVDRPILNIVDDSISEKEKEQIDQFINGDYSSKLKSVNIDQYRIENVVQKFLSLA